MASERCYCSLRSRMFYQKQEGNIMDVRNCRRCGRMFNYLGGPPICKACKDLAEEKFQTTKEYIRNHPKAPISEITKECDVSANQIQQWVREERLEFSADSPIGLSCENCGATIRTGRFCKDCKEHMSDSLANAIAKPEAPKAPEKPKKKKEHDAMRFARK